MSKEKDTSKIVNNDAPVEVKKAMGFLSWIQEYSKKITTSVFIIFCIANIVYLGVTFYAYIYAGMDMMYFDTFLTEIHTTFREVVGGYIIKAAAENVLKIGGSYVEKILVAKYNTSNNDDIDYSYNGGIMG